jgi:hypothetical protein
MANIFTEKLFPFLKEKVKEISANLAEKIVGRDKVQEWTLSGLSAMRATAELTATGIDDLILDSAIHIFKDKEMFDKWFDTIITELGFKVVPVFGGEETTEPKYQLETE